MNTHADITQKNKSQSVANEISQKQGGCGESTFQFADNRPEAVAQRKLQVMANNYTTQKLQLIQKKEIDTKTSTQTDDTLPKSISGIIHSNDPLPALVQLKKTAMPAWSMLTKLESDSRMKDKTVDENRQAVWDECQNDYNKAKTKGNKLSIDLAFRDKKPNNSTARLNEMQSKFEKNYKTRILPKTFPVGVLTAGYLGEVPPADNEMTGQYENRIDLDTGTIIADNNKGTKDPLEKNRLPNSEVLWQQYRAVAKQQLGADFPESKAMSSISKIIRHIVANAESQRVVFMAYPDGEAWKDGNDRDWLPHTEEYNAILGTPNGQSAAYMLLDHFEEIGEKTLGIIRTTGSRDIEINLDDSMEQQWEKSSRNI